MMVTLVNMFFFFLHHIMQTGLNMTLTEASGDGNIQVLAARIAGGKDVNESDKVCNHAEKSQLYTSTFGCFETSEMVVPPAVTELVKQRDEARQQSARD
jgi:hypothetical protein